MRMEKEKLRIEKFYVTLSDRHNQLIAIVILL